METYKIGVVTHYYDKIKVAIVELTNSLGVGDKVRFVRGGEDLFTQTIESLQIENEKVENVKKGETVGIKTQEPVKEGAEIYKI